MIEDLVARVFAARDAAHRAHWRTNSYSAHMALGAFYDGAIDQIDSIVESYQGAFGLIGDFTVEIGPVANIAAYLADDMGWIQTHRNVIARDNTAVQNLIDGLLEQYQTTLYKLNNLS